MDIDSYIKEIKLLDKTISNSVKKNIIDQLQNTTNKLKVINNLYGENKDLPIGLIIEFYTENDELIMQTTQG